ncbi:hypothetical protein G6021_06515 [Dietzia sp. CW19]|uniref:SipW-dependent-type signal peptide-containing protein n=1 Tax=Dietzia sp. CW19 TaxID=1630634 RepID=UPI0015F93A7B|nr:SipW-dependent-type signal peptide-containing protein [Dietzia sp. CW19]MBB1050783.1 hypothetical protein [Dietzia sp. CW19]
MDATTPLAPEAQRKQDRARKRKAILAGGVVLGLGAAVTLAAWSDDVFANGTFQTGTFNLVGSPKAASETIDDYTEYNTASSAANLTTRSSSGGVNFKIDSLNLSPGETVVAPFSIATDSATTVDGRYWLESATATGPLAPFLEFAIVKSATCVAEDPATTAPEQTPLTSPWKGGAFAADPQTLAFGSVRSATGTGPDIALVKGFGNQSHLCIGVTLDEDEDAIKTASAAGGDGATSILWRFAGESLPLTN